MRHGSGPARRRGTTRPGDDLSSLVDPDAFPVLVAERERGRTYLDSAATTQKPAEVIETVRAFLETGYASVGRGHYPLSERASRAFERARMDVGRLVGAEDPAREIVFTSGATDAINLVARAWGSRALRAGDEIALTSMEHHANLLPWQLLCAETGARLVEVRPDATGIIEASAWRRAIGPRTRLVGLCHVSNVLGTVNDVRPAVRAARAVGARVLVDGAQAPGHLPVDVKALGCDLYAASGHKMYGPSGVRFLYGRRDLLRDFGPYRGGGGMIDEVWFDRATYADPPERLEAGTPNIEGVLGLGAAARYVLRMDPERIRRHDRRLAARALDRLGRLPGIEIYGPRDPALRSGLVSFNLKGVHPHDGATILAAEGIAVRAGHLCAQPLMRRLGIPACLRASFALYSTGQDVDRLAEGLRDTARCFGAA